MKKLTTLLTFVLLLGFTFTAQAADEATRKQIKMKVEPKMDHRSIPAPCPAIVFISGSILEVELYTPVKNVIISIINMNTGEAIYHTMQIGENSTIVKIENNDDDTNYKIELSSGNQLYIGEFSLN